MNTDEDPTKSALGALITQLRQKFGLSMYQLAERTRINRSTLKRIEDGKYRRPSADVLAALAYELCVEPDDLHDAVWQNCEDPLPSPATYFRCKYHLSEQQIAELDAATRRIITRSGGP